MSNSSVERHLRQIIDCTKAIAFLGTPHSGAGLAAWVSPIAKLFRITKQGNPKIVESLKRESEVLERIQTGFHTLLRQRTSDSRAEIAITCFYEELPLPGIAQVRGSIPPDVLPGQGPNVGV